MLTFIGLCIKVTTLTTLISWWSQIKNRYPRSS